ncbi:polyprenyl synthetase family protein [Natronoarchaeum sp. GCM10025321]|uniref:polyprenyl synthetase family protein n=1 Tax=Natronoarchaeum sp. GCM10025321 TaxID=3252684 RepID=UPI0036228F28
MKFLERRRGLVEDRLEAVLENVEPTELSEEVQQVALSGGKRVRPLVTVLACEAAGGEAEDAVDFGVGIELVHNASLVVDDVIDQSEMRRGVESAWTAHGYGPAIVASDGLLGEAFELFSDEPRAMQAATEAMIELGEGEATELVAQPTNEEEYMQLARRKTGALFRAAAELGAIAAGADPFDVEAFGEYAERMGVAFQIRDDVLDTTADAEALGKPTNQDAEMDRPSVVQVTDLTPDEATALAREEADAAIDALERTEAANTDAGEYLRDLAEFVVVREH